MSITSVQASRGAANPQPEAGPAGVAVFDLDRTLTVSDTFVAFLLGFLLRAPSRWPRALTLPGAVALYCAGLRDNTWLKTTFLRAILGGLQRDALVPWIDRFVERLLARGLRRDALRKMDWHRAKGDRLVLATASPDLYVIPLAARLGFDAVVSTRVAWDAEERVLGGLIGRNCYGAEKLARVEAWLGRHKMVGPVSVYTDHHSDLALLQRAEHPVAVCPTRKLRAAARAQSFAVEDWR
ncbi:MAG: HAD-IB family hydrolase [Alphaproteobacteria bacterium]|nr:HAD-IB family hydrolase [Alphaproteobacteria bacterium]